MASPVRFWGTVVAVKPRLVLTKVGGQTSAKCQGHLLVLEGTRTEDGGRPVPGRFTIALGPATQERRAVAPGDLLRGDAHPVPEGVPDTPADLYRVGTLRVVARAGDPGTPPPAPAPDPPRTDPPLTSDAAEAAPRRPLAPANLDDDERCAPCPYGVVVPVVRLIDPRDWRSRTGNWSHVPACLGPRDCPYYEPPA
jgi:hypothetical protein